MQSPPLSRPGGRRFLLGTVDLNFIAQAATNGGLLYGRSFWGYVSMESIRPDNADPVPLRMSHRSMKTLIVRFVGLLIATIAVMALIYSVNRIRGTGSRVDRYG